MNLKNLFAFALAVSLTGSAVLAAAAPPISMSAARTIALKAVPGKVVAQELENEKGGSGRRYSFDIKFHGKTYEVGVDAKTGKILENAVEGKNPD